MLLYSFLCVFVCIVCERFAWDVLDPGCFYFFDLFEVGVV